MSSVPEPLDVPVAGEAPSFDPAASPGANEAGTGTPGAPGEHAELRQRIAELEQYKENREREDAIADITRRYQYITPEVMRAFGDVSPEQLEVLAQAVNTALHERNTAGGIGAGGLTPNSPSEQSAQWSGAFSRARQERQAGRSQTMVVGSIR